MLGGLDVEEPEQLSFPVPRAAPGAINYMSVVCLLRGQVRCLQEGGGGGGGGAAAAVGVRCCWCAAAAVTVHQQAQGKPHSPHLSAPLAPLWTGTPPSSGP